MALQTAYRQFLAAPNSSALAPDASLHYVTTTTSFHGPTDIIKHLNSLRNQVKKAQEDVLSAVEGRNAIAVEIETNLEFLSTGAVYLPGLDDNFVIDRSVHLAVLHMVTFDGSGKIAQIRQSWDQGSLLKQLDVIGKTGRNWPIRDSKEQIRLITNSVKSGGNSAAAAAKPRSDSTATTTTTRSRGNSNILRDPHASLALFAPREEVDAQPKTVVSPYGGSRPRQRSFAEILGDEEPEEPATPPNGRGRSQSPNKAVAPKGAGKNFQPIRLFDQGEEAEFNPDTPDKTKSPDRFIRPNPRKYQHFDFADGSDPQDAPRPSQQPPRTKHDSNWSFEDFVTPQKALATRGVSRPQDVRHWGAESENGNENENAPPAAAAAAAADAPPKKLSQQVKARRDAEAHFEFIDDGGPADEPRLIGRPRGSAHNTGLGLYENNLYNEDGVAPADDPDARALGNITNLKDRRKDFDAHFAFTDKSPGHASGSAAQGGNNAAKVGEDRKKVVRMMESNWASYDESPASQKENSNPTGGKPAAGGKNRGIAISGDGMGGKKGSGRAWAIGEDSDDERDNARPAPGRKQTSQKPSTIWDF